MIEFYKKKMNDMSLSEVDRKNYATMYHQATNKEAAEEARAEAKLQEQKELAAVGAEAVDDCAGGACKI